MQYDQVSIERILGCCLKCEIEECKSAMLSNCIQIIYISIKNTKEP